MNNKERLADKLMGKPAEGGRVMEKCKTCYLVNAKPCYECSACINGDDHYKYWPNTQTNAQRIRGMSDEELAEFLWEQNGSNRYWKSVDKYVNWLKQPAETEG